jgi:hypothetical protein
MAENTMVRIEIGFEGGQILSELVAAADADGLEQALMAGREPVHAITTEDGRYLLALGRVLYVKRRAGEGRVGFGG